MVAPHDFPASVAQQVPFLTRVVRSLVRGDQIADDMVQQTILKALMNADQFRSESALTTWLASIAVNEVRQAYRCAWRRRTVPLMTDNLDVDRYARIASPHDTYEADERDALVRDAVSRLPKMYRSVVELCDLYDVPLNEAARKLTLSLPAVKSRRHRARQKLLRLVPKPKSMLLLPNNRIIAASRAAKRSLVVGQHTQATPRGFAKPSRSILPGFCSALRLELGGQSFRHRS
ncbi:MAG: RNA polymerase sigma factor [Acidobacteriaceae bacterium]|nr:RNA polymerase sigma factor [Acidobacteriaceae bacterium]